MRTLSQTSYGPLNRFSKKIHLSESSKTVTNESRFELGRIFLNRTPKNGCTSMKGQSNKNESKR